MELLTRFFLCCKSYRTSNGTGVNEKINFFESCR